MLTSDCTSLFSIHCQRAALAAATVPTPPHIVTHLAQPSTSSRNESPIDKVCSSVDVQSCLPTDREDDANIVGVRPSC